MGKIKQNKPNLIPGTIVSGMQIVDKKGRVRTIPKGVTAKEFQELIYRKLKLKEKQATLELAKKTNIPLPKTIQNKRLVEILNKMGFKQAGQSFFHSVYGHFPGNLLAGRETVLRNNPVLVKVLKAWLKAGNTI